MSRKRGRSPSPPSSSNVFRSSTIDEQKSVFKAAFSPSLTTKALQSLPDLQSATHKIAAWRKRSRQLSLMPATKILYDVGHDDDGEKWAGSRLDTILKEIDVEGTVVVARWYGGQNIGPIRFTHIENCAKEAIWKWRVADAEAKKEEVVKKQKTEEDAKKKEMVKDLKERDYNIATLRKLLSEKKAKLDDTDPVPPTPQKLQVYEEMSMETLAKMEKARDASISFILKEIDKVDEKLQLAEVLEDATQDSWLNVEDQLEGRADAPSTPK